MQNMGAGIERMLRQPQKVVSPTFSHICDLTSKIANPLPASPALRASEPVWKLGEVPRPPSAIASLSAIALAKEDAAP